MRPSIIAVAWGALLAASACAQERPAPSPTPVASAAPTASTAPPAALAAPAEIPATKVYVFGLLKKGPKWTPDETPELRALQEKHLAHLERLGREGKLVAAGPSGEGDLRGILIFALESPEEAQPLADADPAVQAGRLKAELRRFVGSGGIGRKVEAERAKAGKLEMVEYQLALVRLGRHFRPSESNENRALFMARNQWLQQLESSGQLALSGPFLDSRDLTGALILRAGSLDAARKLVGGDPAVLTERFAVDVYPLWLVKGTLD
jgi:uncharacterized protein YciI